jgi:hypothetical protein
MAKKKVDFQIVDVWIDEAWGADGKLKGFDIGWRTKSAGFGHTAFAYNEKGELVCDNETMGKKFIMSVFEALIDKAEMADNP